jgi:hypothetical protein
MFRAESNVVGSWKQSTCEVPYLVESYPPSAATLTSRVTKPAVIYPTLARFTLTTAAEGCGVKRMMTVENFTSAVGFEFIESL